MNSTLDNTFLLRFSYCFFLIFFNHNIKNILNFEQEFPDATVIKLEQNYRSTGNILDAANAVISLSLIHI